jgi:hypothetical protein
MIFIPIFSKNFFLILKVYVSEKIKEHLCNASAFTAFKRWIVRDNPRLLKEFEAYLA